MKDRRQQLLEKKKRLEQQLKELDERELGRKQNDDLKRAQLAGKAMLKHAKIDPQFAATLRNILDRSVSGKRNRQLLDLSGDRSREQNEGQVTHLEESHRELYS